MRDKSNLGQHFLIDNVVLETIIKNSRITKKDIVLEIGPGKGILTKKLSDKCKKLITVELDADLIPLLERIDHNIEVINKDIIKIIDKLRFNKIIANIPYHISEPLMKKVLREDIELMILLVGENFWKILKKEKKLYVMLNSFFEIKKIKTVSPTSFEPKPRVNSVILSFIKKDQEFLKKFDKIMNELLLQKDKKLKNGLRNTIINMENKTKREAALIVENLKIPDDIQNKSILSLSNENFAKLVLFIKNYLAIIKSPSIK